MTLDAGTLLQILIFAIGIYVVLGFLAATRGTGLVRGLGVALLFVFGGLFGLAKQLGLAELEYILQGVFGFIVVILAVVFQPELRRGIVSLGENPLLRRLVRTQREGVVEEVTAAVTSMARKKQGALIVFERDVPLDEYMEKGVRIDAQVNRLLLESIFEDGGALHDGAVIVRGKRIESAASILPLSENEELAKTIGTRHRAALGLAEETDAVAIVVSEETGLISICAKGQMERRIPRTEVEALLRMRLGKEKVDAARLSVLQRAQRSVFGNFAQKLLAVVLATGLYWIAWRDVHRVETFELEVVAASDVSRAPEAGALKLLLPDPLAVAVLTDENGARVRRVTVRVDAAQARLQELAAGVGGLFEVPEAWLGEVRALDPSAFVWGAGGPVSGVVVQWAQQERLNLEVRRYTAAACRVTPGELDLAPTGTPEGYEVVSDSMRFDPGTLRLVGPPDSIKRFLADPTSLPIVAPDLSGADGPSFSRRIMLDPARAGDVRLEGDVFLHGELVEVVRDLGRLPVDVVLVSFDAASRPPLERFEAPVEQVELLIRSRGLLPRGADDEVIDRYRLEVRELARQYARVWIDVDRLDGLRGRLQVPDLDEAWRMSPAPAFDAARDNPRARLWLELAEDDNYLVLVRREPQGDPNDEPKD
ncbi:MAG: diadenylate cyclase [Planctomycetota bacterium]